MPLVRTIRLALALTVSVAALGPLPARATAENDAMRDAAYEAAQWIMFTTAAHAVAGVGARLAAGDDALGALIRERQDLEAAASAARDAVTAALAAGTDPAADEAALRTATARIATLEADITRRFPAYAEFAVPRPLSLPETQALLEPGEALVLIMSAAAGTYVWAVTHDQAAWTRSEVGEAAMARTVRDLRSTLDPTAPARAAVALDPVPATGRGFDRGLAHALYGELLAPLSPMLAGAGRVNVVTTGPLASLPLALLVTEPPAGNDADPAALAGTPWLIRRHALVSLPAVSSLASLRRAAARAGTFGPQTFVGIGAPLLDGPAGGDVVLASRGAALTAQPASSARRLADPEAVRRLPALPGTLRELNAIAALFPAADRTLMTGAGATETQLRAADLSGARVLHFATHGLVSGEIAGLTEAALVLTPPQVATAQDDGLLTASEASSLALDADWVILSACNTAAGDDLGGESLSGLARAFFHAGARALLVSHWPVRDDAAARLVTDTMGRLRADPALGRAEALQAAMLDTMKVPGMEHPSAWAPFVIVGDGRALR